MIIRGSSVARVITNSTKMPSLTRSCPRAFRSSTMEPSRAWGFILSLATVKKRLIYPAGYYGNNDPNNRESLWQTRFSKQHPLYQFIKTVVTYRKQAQIWLYEQVRLNLLTPSHTILILLVSCRCNVTVTTSFMPLLGETRLLPWQMLAVTPERLPAPFLTILTRRAQNCAICKVPHPNHRVWSLAILVWLLLIGSTHPIVWSSKMEYFRLHCSMVNPRFSTLLSFALRLQS